MNIKNIAGKRFGKLVALYPTNERNAGNIVWLCQCDCGKFFKTTCTSLITGRTLSCGCMRKQKASENAKAGNNRRTHGMSKSKIYYVWMQMKNRCHNPESAAFKNYGGRGITVCEEWKNSFQAFYDYVSQLPHFNEEGYSLDRINNDGNYEPNNVRWATRAEQNNNKRNTGRKMKNGIAS